ncbi:maleylpyruvate isomerase family mycothiol-dependent enzyme [Nocardia sp. NBC_01377]|uniref:maleylpyruvate isomerase family mycothiol-dependent enzyme n=1 Tax=Nocardia sp. NBC_01377 TaxID=2903595 RepID=UPI0032536899
MSALPFDGPTTDEISDHPPLPLAVEFLRETLEHVGTDLSVPTPCHGWDLRMLLAHLDESIATLREGLTTGRIGPPPTRPRPNCAGTEPIRLRAEGLLADWTRLRPHPVTIGDLPIPTTVLGAAAALELTAHAWDLGQSTGQPTLIPDGLAHELLPVAHQLVPIIGRSPLFAPPLRSSAATAGDRLLSHLGRTPRPDTA